MVSIADFPAKNMTWSDPSPSISKFIKNKKQNLLDSMNIQAKRRNKIRKVNTITEFGEIPMSAINSRKVGKYFF